MRPAAAPARRSACQWLLPGARCPHVRASRAGFGAISGHTGFFWGPSPGAGASNQGIFTLGNKLLLLSVSLLACLLTAACSRVGKQRLHGHGQFNRLFGCDLGHGCSGSLCEYCCAASGVPARQAARDPFLRSGAGVLAVRQWRAERGRRGEYFHKCSHALPAVCDPGQQQSKQSFRLRRLWGHPGFRPLLSSSAETAQETLAKARGGGGRGSTSLRIVSFSPTARLRSSRPARAGRGLGGGSLARS